MKNQWAILEDLFQCPTEQKLHRLEFKVDALHKKCIDLWHTTDDYKKVKRKLDIQDARRIIKSLEEHRDRLLILYGQARHCELWYIAEAMQDAVDEIEKLRKKIYWLRLTPKQKENRKEINIEVIKENVKILDLMDSVGCGQSARASRNTFFYKSPFRNEKTASFCVYSDNNSFYDFGSGEGGDVIDLYMRINNCDFKEAIKYLSTLC